VDLRRQIGIVRTWFPLFVISVVLATGAAFIFSSLQPKIYEAEATLIVGQSLTDASPDINQLLVSQRLSTTYATVATRRPNLQAVIDDLGLDTTVEELGRQVVAEAPVDSTLVTITVQDQDPALAAAIANGIADGLISLSPAIQGRTAELQASIEEDLSATQDQISDTQARVEELTGMAERTPEQEAELATLEGRLVSLRATYTTLLGFSTGNATNQLSIIEPAVAPKVPVGPRVLLNVALAAVLGLVLAVAIALMIELVRDPIKDSDDVEATLGVSTLGAVGRMRAEGGRSQIYQLATLLYPRSAAAEAFRTLRTNIEFAAVDAPVRTLLVTSSSPGEGKTVMACNLAVAFAQSGKSVLLVDADLRKPGVHQLFDLPNAQGLTSLLRNEEVGLDAVAQGTEQGNLRVITTGSLPPNPAELLGSQRMRALLDRMLSEFDLVVFDSPPLRAVADAAILSSFLDGTVFVVDTNSSRRRAVRQGRDALSRAGAHVLGVVLNRISGVGRTSYGGYYVAYGLDEQKRASRASEEPGRQPG
jgi:capsular exopolysaccharide synthesis family protein